MNWAVISAKIIPTFQGRCAIVDTMRPGHIKLPKDEAAVAARAAGFERKQKWKELPGNRYTPKELREMSDSLGPFTIDKPKIKEMYID